MKWANQLSANYIRDICNCYNILELFAVTSFQVICFAGLVMVFAQPVDLPAKVHGVEHHEEFGIETVLGAFGQFAGLDPEVGLRWIGDLYGGICSSPATLPSPPADLQEKLSSSELNQPTTGAGFFNMLIGSRACR